MDVSDQLCRRGLAVGAGHGDELIGEQAPAELELPQNGQAAPAGVRDRGRLRRDAGALDERARALRQRGRLRARTDLHPARRELIEPVGGAGVEADHLLPPLGQRERGRPARSRQPHDHVGTRRQRRSRTVRERWLRASRSPAHRALRCAGHLMLWR